MNDNNPRSKRMLRPIYFKQTNLLRHITVARFQFCSVPTAEKELFLLAHRGNFTEFIVKVKRYQNADKLTYPLHAKLIETLSRHKNIDYVEKLFSLKPVSRLSFQELFNFYLTINKITKAEDLFLSHSSLQAYVIEDLLDYYKLNNLWEKNFEPLVTHINSTETIESICKYLFNNDLIEYISWLQPKINESKSLETDINIILTATKGDFQKLIDTNSITTMQIFWLEKLLVILVNNNVWDVFNYIILKNIQQNNHPLHEIFKEIFPLLAKSNEKQFVELWNWLREKSLLNSKSIYEIGFKSFLSIRQFDIAGEILDIIDNDFNDEAVSDSHNLLSATYRLAELINPKGK